MGEIAAEYPSPEKFCDRVNVFPIPSETQFGRRAWVFLSGLWKSAPYDHRWLNSSELRDFLQSDVSTGSIDLVHLDTIGLAQFGAIFPTVPTVMNHHNIESHMMRRRANQEESLLKSTYMQMEAEKLARWEKQWCPQYEENLVVSSLDGKRLEKTAPGSEWTVVANGVDVEYFRPDDTVDTEREGLVFVGRMSWYPNRDAIEWLLNDIWPALLRDDPDRRLTLVGSSPPPQAESVRGVTVTGFVPDVRPFMNQASIYICPIRTGGGTRLKILDAMAMGMPLVATEMSVEGLELEDGRHFISAESISDFVNGVRRLEEDNDLRNRLTSEARAEAVERFSWSHIATNISSAYKRAVSK